MLANTQGLAATHSQEGDPVPALRTAGVPPALSAKCEQNQPQISTDHTDQNSIKSICSLEGRLAPLFGPRASRPH
jgi:hypothetical protein